MEETFSEEIALVKQDWFVINISPASNLDERKMGTIIAKQVGSCLRIYLQTRSAPHLLGLNILALLPIRKQLQLKLILDLRL